MLDENPLCEFQDLKHHGRCKFVLYCFGRWLNLTPLCLDSLDLLQCPLRLLRSKPLVVPVEFLAICPLAALSSSFQNEFRDVLFRWAMNPPIAKVLNDSRSFLANRSEIEGISSRVKARIISN